MENILIDYADLVTIMSDWIFCC